MNFSKVAFTGILILLGIGVGSNRLHAQAPNLLNYQGKLTTATGTPASGSFNITFSIYSTLTGGTALWTETQNNVPVTNGGVFNVALGSAPGSSGIPSSVFTSSGERYLGIKVGSDPEMSPRFRLTSVTFAIRASEADGVVDGSISSNDIADGAIASVDINDGTVASIDINDGTIASIDINDGTIQAADLANGTVTSAKIASSQVVKSLNSLKDDVTIAAGTNVTITPSGNTLTIAATGGSGGGTITGVTAGSGLMGGGTSGNVTLSVQPGGITSAMISDNTVASADIADGTIVDADVSASATISGAKINPNFGTQNIVTTGRVGIGTTDPKAALEVAGVIICRDQLLIDNGKPDGQRLAWRGGVNGAQEYRARLNAEGTLDFFPGEGKPASLSLTQAGNVGIGTTGPDHIFDITAKDKEAQNVVRLGHIAGITNGFRISKDAQNQYTYLFETGNVGIGATTPKTALHIPDRGLQIGTSATASDNFHLASDTFGGPRGLRLYNGNYGTGSHILTALPNGNVGIGTTNPEGILDVVIPADGFVRLGNNASTVSEVRFTNGRLRSDLAKFQIIGQDLFGSASYPITFGQTANDADVTIATNGSVGIGTTNPSGILDVAIPSNGFVRLGQNAIISEVQFTNGRIHSEEAKFQILGQELSGGGVPITFGQSANDFDVTIATNGNVGIGTASPQSKLHVVGDVCSTTGKFITCSDLRYKKNIAAIPSALDKVTRLRGVSFDWRQEEFPKLNFNKGRNLGFIAQEIKEVLPEVVSQDSQGYYSVAYSNVVPVLVEAIKEQQNTIQAQAQELAQTKAALENLQERMRRLEVLLAKTDRSLAVTGQ